METRFQTAAGRGQVEIREEEGRVRVRAELADDRRGLYKAWLLGRGGRFPLGALLPEGKTLALTRTLSRAELERRGFWPVRGAAVELAFSPGAWGQEWDTPRGWRREENPWKLLGEPLLRQSARDLRGALLRREERGFQLAVPWREGRPFPLTPLFCFARIVPLGGAMYAVFAFSGGGCPVLPPP